MMKGLNDNMHILYIAFACNPYAGSEAQCGWAWVASMRNYAQVSVLTRTENREPIQRYLQENNIQNINVFYHDVPDALNIYYKTGRMYHLYYLLWQKTAYSIVKKLHKQSNFDYIHHVTLGDFRTVGKFWKLDTKYIFGPVGGAQVTPKTLKIYVKGDWKTEQKREFINCLVGLNPFYRKALNQTSLILAANQETLEFLKKCLKDKSKCQLLTENGVRYENVISVPQKQPKNAVSLLWAGRMVNKKGLSFLLDAMTYIHTNQDFVLHLVGDGPEKQRLQEQAKCLGIENKVIFHGKVSYEEMKRFYSESDLFVFPSLRETTGTVLFEAMSHGLPVITFDQNGAALLIDHTCGRKINIWQDIEKIKSDFANAITELIDSAKIRDELSVGAFNKIRDEYLWEKKCLKFKDMYLK